MATQKIKIIFGKAFQQLSRPINIGSQFDVIPTELTQFPNQETRVRIKGDLDGEEVFILNPTLTNDHIIELSLLADAAGRLGAKKVTAVTPWLGYTPQDKVFRKGEPLSSQVIIRMLESAGIDHFITADLHSPLLGDMFRVELTNISAQEMFVRFWKRKISDPASWVVVALDKGSFERNKQLAQALGTDFQAFSKERDRNTGEIKMNTGKVQLTDKKVITYDDFTSTGGTLVKAAELIHALGAIEFHCLVTHIVTASIFDRIRTSSIDSLTTTNSTFLSELARENRNIQFLDIWEYLLTNVIGKAS